MSAHRTCMVFNKPCCRISCSKCAMLMKGSMRLTVPLCSPEQSSPITCHTATSSTHLCMKSTRKSAATSVSTSSDWFRCAPPAVYTRPQTLFLVRLVCEAGMRSSCWSGTAQQGMHARSPCMFPEQTASERCRWFSWVSKLTSSQFVIPAQAVC